MPRSGSPRRSEAELQRAHYLGLLHKAQAGAERLQPFVERYGEDAPDEPERLHSELFKGTREVGLGLLHVTPARRDAAPLLWLRSRMKEAATQALVVTR